MVLSSTGGKTKTVDSLLDLSTSLFIICSTVAHACSFKAVYDSSARYLSLLGRKAPAKSEPFCWQHGTLWSCDLWLYLHSCVVLSSAM